MLDSAGKEFIKKATSRFNAVQYQYDKYKLLDLFMSEILVNRFHIPGLSLVKPEANAEALIMKMVEDYFIAVRQSEPFCDILGPLYMEVQNNWRGSKPLGEHYIMSSSFFTCECHLQKAA